LCKNYPAQDVETPEPKQVPEEVKEMEEMLKLAKSAKNKA